MIEAEPEAKRVGRPNERTGQTKKSEQVKKTKRPNEDEMLVVPAKSLYTNSAEITLAKRNVPTIEYKRVTKVRANERTTDKKEWNQSDNQIELIRANKIRRKMN